MIILVYASIVLLMIGTYNMICYLMMLPTAKAGRNMLSVGEERKSSFWDACTVMIAEYFVKRYELEWCRSEEMDKRLFEKEIYTDSTVYLIGKSLYYFSGLFLIIPLMLIDRRLFSLLFIVWTMIRGWSFKIILGTETGVEIKQKYRKMMLKLLPEAFFIAQILLLLCLFI